MPRSKSRTVARRHKSARRVRRRQLTRRSHARRTRIQRRGGGKFNDSHVALEGNGRGVLADMDKDSLMKYLEDIAMDDAEKSNRNLLESLAKKEPRRRKAGRMGVHDIEKYTLGSFVFEWTDNKLTGYITKVVPQTLGAHKGPGQIFISINKDDIPPLPTGSVHTMDTNKNSVQERVVNQGKLGLTGIITRIIPSGINNEGTVFIEGTWDEVEGKSS